MPTEAEMMSDLDEADKAGKTDLARNIMGRIRALRATPDTAPAFTGNPGPVFAGTDRPGAVPPEPSNRPLTLNGQPQPYTPPVNTAPDMPAEEARRSLELGRTYDLSASSPEDVRQLKINLAQRDFAQKLKQLPRIEAFAAEDDAHASVMQKEVDNWAPLEYLFGRTFNTGGNVEEGVLEHGETHYTPPPWMLSIGRSAWSMTGNIQTFVEKNWGYNKSNWDRWKEGRGTLLGVDETKDVLQEREARASQPLPGDKDPVLGTLNRIAGLTPLVAGAVVHPALAWGMMHADTTGRVYTNMRMSGYDEETSRDVSEGIGFSVASIGAALGPLFRWSPVTEATKFLTRGVPQAVTMSMAKNPEIWGQLIGLGKNFMSNMTMNMAQVGAETTTREAFDSAREGRPYNTSKVVNDLFQSTHAWAEMAALSLVPAYEHGKAAKVKAEQGAADEAASNALSLEDQKAMDVMDSWEERGLGIRSMYEGYKILAAVDAIKNSDLAKESPEVAKQLARSLISPSKKQSVYINAETLAGMDPDSLTMFGVFDPSTPDKVSMDLVDFLMHPDAASLVNKVSSEPGLLTLGEAKNVDLAPKEGAKPEPTDAAPTIDPGKIPQGDLALRKWAEDSVSRVPASDLLNRSNDHINKAGEAGEEAESHTKKIANQKEAGEDTAEAEAKLKDAKDRAGRHLALAKAATAARKAVWEVAGSFGKLFDAEPDKHGFTPRQSAWHAGEEYGAAYDAVGESLGLLQKRGYAASDLSDVAARMAGEKRISQEKFEGWDANLVDGVLKHTRERQSDTSSLSLAEWKELHKATLQITQAADAENVVLRNGETVAKNIIGQEISEHLKNITDVSRGRQVADDNPKALPALTRAKAKSAKFEAIFEQPHTIFGKLGKNGDWLYYDMFIGGLAKHDRMWGDAKTRLQAIHESIPEEVRQSGNDVVPSPSAFFSGDDTKTLWTRSQVWDLALKLGVQGEDGKLAGALGLSKSGGVSAATQLVHGFVHEHIARSDEHAHIIMEKLIQPHWKLFGDLWSDYQQSFKDRRLAPPKEVKGTTLWIRGKKYEGGYGGRQQYEMLDHKPDQPGSLSDLLANGFSGPSTDTRHLIEREATTNNKPLFNWEGVAGSLEKEIHDISMTPFVEMAHKVLSDENLRKVISAKIGKETLNQLYDPKGSDSFLHTVARGGVQNNLDPASKLVLNLAGRAAYSAFALNFRVMGGQMSHILAAMPALGISPEHMAVGVRAAFSTDGRESARARYEVAQLRYSDYEEKGRELSRQLSGFEQGGTRVHRATDRFNWASWREMDSFLTTAIAEAKYHQMMDPVRLLTHPAVSHEEAVMEANKAVTKMMPPVDIYDQPAFVRNKTIAGMFYMVKNFPLTLLNTTISNWWDAKASGNKMEMAKQPFKYVGMMLAVGAIGEAWAMRGGAPDNKDKATWWLEHTMGAMFYPTMLREPVMAGYYAATGDRHSAKQEMERLTPAALQLVIQSIDDVGRAFGEGDEEAAKRAAARVLSVGLKSPLPMKGYDLLNAASNSQDPLDAAKKALGYRQ